ncbi:MAG: HEAT repeat domain-containing protein, partial [Candidatus Helarchaeota archaeon]|nr:HEAT repeat domain-containing protein [Candidatus Helarchaeota archaeon]
MAQEFLVRTIETHNSWVNYLVITPDGKYIVTASGNETIKVWDSSTGELIRAVQGFYRGVRSVAVSPDGKYLVGCSSDNWISIWELSTGKEIHSINTGSRGKNFWVCVSQDGTLVINGIKDINKGFKFWDISTGKNVRWVYNASTRISIPKSILSPDLKFIIEPTQTYDDNKHRHDYIIRIWEVPPKNESKPKLFNTIYAHPESITSIAISSDGKYIFTNSGDGTIKVWELETGNHVRTYEVGPIIDLMVISPDGEFILGITKNNLIQIWELSTGRSIQILKGHQEGIKALAISPDGQFIVSGSKKVIQIWDFSKIVKNFKEGLQELINELKDSNDEKRTQNFQNFTTNLLKMRPSSERENYASPKIVQLIIEALDDNVPEIRLAAVDILRLLNASQSIEALKKVLKDRDPRLRIKATLTLGSLGDKSAIDPLISCLKNEDTEVRELTVELLGKLKDDRAIEPLKE